MSGLLVNETSEATFTKVIQAAIAYNNFDAEQREFFKKYQLSDPRAKTIYTKLKERLDNSVIEYVQENFNL